MMFILISRSRTTHKNFAVEALASEPCLIPGQSDLERVKVITARNRADGELARQATLVDKRAL